MNNIFNTYKSNNYYNYIKSNINLNTPLNHQTLYIIVNNMYYNNNYLVKYGLTKFIKTVLNIYYNNLSDDSIYILLLLAFKNIPLEYIKINKNDIYYLLLKTYNNPEIIMSEIITSLSYYNRFHFNKNYRNNLFKFMINNMNEKFTTEDNTNNADNSNNTDNKLVLYNDYYLLENDTLHNFNKSEKLILPPYFDQIKQELTSAEIIIFLENFKKAVNLMVVLEDKIKNIKNINFPSNDINNYYLALYQKIKDIIDDKNILKSRILDYKLIIDYIYHNFNNINIKNMNINDIIKKSHFSLDIKNIKNVNDLKNLDEDSLYNYKLFILRNSIPEEIIKLVNIYNLLDKLYNSDKNQYYLFINLIAYKFNNIDFNNYNNLSGNIKDYIINHLNNVELNTIINYSKKKDIISNLNNKLINEKIILLQNNIY